MCAKQQKQPIYAGCDLGIRSAKAVIIDNGTILASEIVPYRNYPHKAAEAAIAGALRRASLPADAVAYCLATGFGEKAVRFASGVVPNITCILRGMRALNPQVRTVIDIGGHTMRVSNTTSDGELHHTALVEECAASTGLFLEMMAKGLGFPLEKLASKIVISKKPIRITNTCVVFAESDVISFINEGYSHYDVFAGVATAVASKITSIARRIDVLPEVAMVGGVAKNVVVKSEVEKHLGLEFADLGGIDPRVVAAFGAALLAGEGYPAGMSVTGVGDDSCRM